MTGTHTLAPGVAGAFLAAVAELAAPGAGHEVRTRAAASLRAAAAGVGLLSLHPATAALLAAAGAVARGDLAPGVDAARGLLASLESFASAFGVTLAGLPEFGRLPPELRQPGFVVAIHDLADFALPRRGVM